MGYDHKSQSFENVLYSMASLEIASHAVTFIGNLHTPWDQLVNTIQRTRGDSGSDYYSVEPTATGYSTCVK